MSGTTIDRLTIAFPDTKDLKGHFEVVSKAIEKTTHGNLRLFRNMSGATVHGTKVELSGLKAILPAGYTATAHLKD